MRRQLQLDAGTLRPRAPVLDVVREAFLTAVEVDAGDALAGLHQGDGDMHRGGRFPRASLLVPQHDHVPGTRQSHRRLQQHNATPYPESFSESNRVGVKRMYTLLDLFRLIPGPTPGASYDENRAGVQESQRRGAAPSVGALPQCADRVFFDLSAGCRREFRTQPRYSRPRSRSSRRKLSGIAAAPGAARSRSLGALLGSR